MFKAKNNEDFDFEDDDIFSSVFALKNAAKQPEDLPLNEIQEIKSDNSNEAKKIAQEFDKFRFCKRDDRNISPDKSTAPLTCHDTGETVGDKLTKNDNILFQNVDEVQCGIKNKATFSDECDTEVENACQNMDDPVKENSLDFSAFFDIDFDNEGFTNSRFPKEPTSKSPRKKELKNELTETIVKSSSATKQLVLNTSQEISSPLSTLKDQFEWQSENKKYSPVDISNITSAVETKSSLCQISDLQKLSNCGISLNTQNASDSNDHSSLKKTSSSCGSINRILNKPRKRKFPGPAGLLPDLPQEADLSALKQSEHSVVSISSEQTISQELLCSQDCVEEFQKSPWQNMLNDMSCNSDVKSLAGRFNIKHVLQQSSRKKLPKHIEAPVFCAILKSITFQASYATAVFKDETGEVVGKINLEILIKYKEYLEPGAVLALKKATFLCNQLIVRLENIVLFYGNDGQMVYSGNWDSPRPHTTHQNSRSVVPVLSENIQEKEHCSPPNKDVFAEPSQLTSSNTIEKSKDENEMLDEDFLKDELDQWLQNVDDQFLQGKTSSPTVNGD